MITNVRILSQFTTDLTDTFSILNCNPKDALFFDIETTGLNPKTNRIFLIGLVFFEPNTKKWQLTQLFSEKSCDKEERELLETFSTFLENKICLIHFNGNSFDIPYLISRFEKYQLPHVFSSKNSLDLYREFLKIPAFFRQMPNHKQKAFEDFICYPRKDLLSGKEMINIYHEYLKTSSKEKEKILLQHNYDDLVGMLSIFSLLTLKQLLKGQWEIANIEELQKQNFHQHNIKEILFTLKLSVPVPAQFSIDFSFGYMTVVKNLAKIKIPLYEGTLKFYYSDYKNYYYLPLEDEAIHKSVAIYTDTQHRQKATASTCYKKYTGFFIYVPHASSLPLLKEDLSSKEAYTFWPFQNSSQLIQQEYIKEILKTAITLS